MRTAFRFAFLIFALWAGASLLASLAVLGSGADLEMISLRQEIRQLLATAPEGPHDQEIAFVDGLWAIRNKLALWHAGTSLLLLVASITAFRSLRVPK